MVGDEARPPPLFILCAPRSYSTVVCAMLGQHPDLYGFPELNLFVAETIGDLLELDDEQERIFGEREASYSAGVRRALATLVFGGQSAEHLEAADQFVQTHRDWPTARVFDVLLDAVAPRHGIDKSPRTAMSRRALERARASHHEPLYLHLVRNPLTNVESISDMMARNSESEWFPACRAGIVEYSAKLWSHTHANILDFTSKSLPGRTLRVRAEDLLSEPDDELARICDWLRISGDSLAVEAMKHPENAPFATPIPGLAHCGDPGFSRAPQLRSVAKPPPIEAVRSWNVAPETLEVVTTVATILGYV